MAAQAPAVPAPPANNAPAFQLSPATLDSQVIDYTTKVGMKFERGATKALGNIFHFSIICK